MRCFTLKYTFVIAFLMINLLANNSLKAQIGSKITAKTPKEQARTLAGGQKYFFYKENKQNPLIKVGDFAVLKIMIKNSKDSIIMNTFTQPEITPQAISKGTKGFVDEFFLSMHKGDSASVWINSDTIVRQMGQAMPPFIAKGSDVQYIIKIVNVMSKAEMDKKEAANKAKQPLEDERLIKEYITKNKIIATRTPSGLYISKTKITTNASPKAGDMVKVHYTGRNLKGEVFDSSVERGQPFEFTLGRGQVIRGWDEGIAMLKKGEKGLLLIPSGLAYGASSQGAKIPANAVLIFEVELF